MELSKNQPTTETVFSANGIDSHDTKFTIWCRVIIATPLLLIAVLLPYRARVVYSRALAWLVHLPFVLFGRLARFLLQQLELANPYDKR